MHRLVTAAVIAAALLGSSLLLGATSSDTQKPLTNEDVVNLVQAGLPQDVVIEKIKTSKTAFDTSTDALVALKKAGVGGEIIRVMVNPAAETKSGGMPGSSNAPAPCQVPPGGQAPWLSGTSPAMWYTNSDAGDRIELTYERGTISHVGFAGFGSSLLVLHPLKASARVNGRAQFLSCINPTDAPLVHFSLESKERRAEHFGRKDHAIPRLVPHLGRRPRPLQIRKDPRGLLQDHAVLVLEVRGIRIRAARNHRSLLAG